MTTENSNQPEMSKAEATMLRMQREYEARKADMATKFSDEEILEAIYQNATSMATVMMQYNRMIDDRWRG
jgi:hypothetical protein